jgi:hypothetical protein
MAIMEAVNVLKFSVFMHPPLANGCAKYKPETRFS